MNKALLVLIVGGAFALTVFIAASNNGSSDQSKNPSNLKLDVQQKNKVLQHIPNKENAEEDNEKEEQEEEENAGADQATLESINQLLRTSYKNYNIHVHLSEGIVSLSGTVNSQKDKDAIEMSVKKIEGVKRVDSRLRIESINK